MGWCFISEKVGNNMRKKAVWLGILLVVTLPLASAIPTSIEILESRSLDSADLGLTGGALSPDGQYVLVYGADGYLHLIDSTQAMNPDEDVNLEKDSDETLQDAAWHPRSQTAYIVGDEATVLRYVKSTHDVQIVTGTNVLGDSDLTSIAWVASGSHAYIGSDDGSIWMYTNGSGFQKLEGTKESQISDIACHRAHNICSFSTLSDGIGIIDRWSNISWVSGTTSDTWLGAACDDGTLNECVYIGSGARIGNLRLDPDTPENSAMVKIWELKELGGEFHTNQRGIDSTSLFTLIPIGLLRYDPVTTDTFTLMVNADVISENVTLSRENIISVWEMDTRTGFFVTSRGSIVSFEPLVDELNDGILTTVLMLVVAIAVPGVFLGLIYWNSPWLQRKYLNWRNRRLEKKKTQP